MLGIYFVEVYCDKNAQRILTYLLGSNVEELKEKLLLANYWPIRIHRCWWGPLRIRWTTHQLVRQTERWQLLLSSGIDLLSSLALMKHQSAETDDRVSQALWASVEQVVYSGEPLAQAIRSYPSFFPRFYAAIIDFAQQSDQLPQALSQLHHFYESQNARDRLWRNLLRYPVFLLLCAAGLLVFKYAYLDAQLKAITDLMRGVDSIAACPASESGRAKKLLQALIGIGLAVGCVTSWMGSNWLKRPFNRMQWFVRQWLCYIPIYGKIYVHSALWQLASMLLLLDQAQVALEPGLAWLANAFQGTPYQTFLKDAQQALQSGEALSRSLRCKRWFSGLWTPLLMLGEEANQMQACLKQLTRYYQESLADYAAELAHWTQTWGMLVIGLLIACFLWRFYAPLMALDEAFCHF